MIRILIVDDVEVMQLGLAVYLETCPDMLLVAASPTATDAIRCCSDLHPDVLLLQLNELQLDGIATLETLQRTFPATSIIILSLCGPDPGYARPSSAAISRLALNTTSLDALADAIRTAYATAA